MLTGSRSYPLEGIIGVFLKTMSCSHAVERSEKTKTKTKAKAVCHPEPVEG
jgi:hypothetical protein